MLICKYTRLDSAAFVPHLDTLRAVTMGIRRIGAKAAYSEGFNPHMKIFFGQPLPIGVESECEYFCVYADEAPEEFMKQLNTSLPLGLRIMAAAKAEKDPNVANLMYSADYTVTMRDKVVDLTEILRLCKGETCEIEYSSKGKTIRKDVRSLILDARAEGENKVYLRLRCGNENLRADRLMAYLCAQCDIACEFDVRKTHMYDCAGSDLDKLFFGSCR